MGVELEKNVLTLFPKEGVKKLLISSVLPILQEKLEDKFLNFLLYTLLKNIF